MRMNPRAKGPTIPKSRTMYGHNILVPSPSIAVEMLLEAPFNVKNVTESTLELSNVELWNLHTNLFKLPGTE